jgi:hypothetical protein
MGHQLLRESGAVLDASDDLQAWVTNSAVHILNGRRGNAKSDDVSAFEGPPDHNQPTPRILDESSGGYVQERKALEQSVPSCLRAKPNN